MKVLLSLLCLFLGAPSQAAEFQKPVFKNRKGDMAPRDITQGGVIEGGVTQGGVTQGGDLFARIKDLFEESDNISFKDVEGFYMGRCYSVNERFHPLSSLLGNL